MSVRKDTLPRLTEISSLLPIQKAGKKDGETGEKTREKIIQALKANPEITMERLAEIIGITSKGIEWQIKRLKEEGFIKRIGPAQGGDWEIV